nr:hypothetical protein CFP56_77745 [Quercus suber]
MQKILSVLQKTEYAATEIQPMDNITETTTDITFNSPVSTDYAENPEPVLQKTEYAAVEIQPWTYITETATYITLSPPESTDYAENPKPVL